MERCTEEVKKLSDREKDFININVEQHSRRIEEEKLIYHDGKQYICKLPKEIMQEIWEKGDKLKFLLNINPKDPTNPNIKVKYVKKNKTN